MLSNCDSSIDIIMNNQETDTCKFAFKCFPTQNFVNISIDTAVMQSLCKHGWLVKTFSVDQKN